MRIRAFGASAIATIGSLFLFGCAATPTKYQIKTSGDPVINRDTTGKPLSVVVRLYQLKDSAEFSKLTFATAASGRSDAELLGADLVDRSETVVVPGVQRVTQAPWRRIQNMWGSWVISDVRTGISGAIWSRPMTYVATDSPSQ